jgi:hypothetical protein
MHDLVNCNSFRLVTHKCVSECVSVITCMRVYIYIYECVYLYVYECDCVCVRAVVLCVGVTDRMS